MMNPSDIPENSCADKTLIKESDSGSLIHKPGKELNHVYAGITKNYLNTISGYYCFLEDWLGIMSFKMTMRKVRNDNSKPSVFALFQKCRRSVGIHIIRMLHKSRILHGKLKFV